MNSTDSSSAAATDPPSVRRIVDGPIIDPGSHPSIGDNIQGPSVVEMPAWATGRLGRFHCWFADHKGRYIRLAHADHVTGPWIVHPAGSLRLEDSLFPTEPPHVDPAQLAAAERFYSRSVGPIMLPLIDEISSPHIASPDVHVDRDRQRFVMYFHGLADVGTQVTRMAVSVDGARFTAHRPTIDRTYLRVFCIGDDTYGMAMPGQLYRFPHGLGSSLDSVEIGPVLLEPTMRHLAVQVRPGHLRVFWTRVGDAPERILMSTIDTTAHWTRWRQSDPVEILRPEHAWEGADAPVEPSLRSSAVGVLNQLRDPAVLEADGRTYLFHAVGGEAGIGVVELVD